MKNGNQPSIRIIIDWRFENNLYGSVRSHVIRRIAKITIPAEHFEGMYLLLCVNVALRKYFSKIAFLRVETVLGYIRDSFFGNLENN